MAHASTFEITASVSELAKKPFDPAEFPYDLLRIYRNVANTTITKLKAGETNPADAVGGVLLKKHLYFKACSAVEDPAVVGAAMLVDPLTKRHQPRFIVATNGADLYAHDRITNDTDNHAFIEDEHWSHFLLPLAPGHERAPKIEEHPADVKAAKLLGRLYDAILKANPTWTAGNHTDALNHLITRLLFCFYAEDTAIFRKNLFTETVTRYTEEDGSDLASLLERLFVIMNVEETQRAVKLSPIEAAFPYVNGSLFEQTFPMPTFDRFARRQLLDCGNLDWTDITPDIFGSMIQTISDAGERANTGMHYTSVPNIRKVLKPLFLEQLHDEYDKASRSVAKLEQLLQRLARIRVFDPACGSGNFLIIAYKELRSLETKVLTQIQALTGTAPLTFNGVSISNFHGIDIAPFACETARLSLWIAEHTADIELRNSTNIHRQTLPLPKITTIHCDNALRVDWTQICPPQIQMETFICGNPQFKGLNAQTPEQRSDITLVVGPILKGDTKVDYVACWLIKLTDYIATNENASGALVATNSICQGEQVAFLWPYVFGKGLCIQFAHTSFKWSNNASHNAVVSCVIIGLARQSPSLRKLYIDSYEMSVKNINAYLVPSPNNIIVTKASKPLNGLPLLVFGNEPYDGNRLLLTDAERTSILQQFPAAAVFIRRIYGAREFIYDIKRYTLWINDDNLESALQVPPIAKRISDCKEWRVGGGQHAQRAAAWPHRFAFVKHREVQALVVPGTSSERRAYLQIGILPSTAIANDSLYVTYDPPGFLFALLSSRMHLIWTKTVGGALENRLRYALALIYNTFPTPTLSDEQKATLAERTKAIIKARERHPGKTLAFLYDPKTMPADLRVAHEANDAYIEEHLYGRTFRDDTHRLEHLFDMYVRMKSNFEKQTSLLDGSVQKRPKKV